MRGQEISLQDAMMAVTQRMETLRAPEPENVRNSMSELEAFIRLDPLLADLHKEFLDTKHNRKKLMAENGCDDPMASVAADLEDSAWCRMQTRYLELRDQRVLMRRAQRLMREEEVQAAKAKQESEKARRGEIYYMVMLMEQERVRRGLPGLLEWFVFMIWVEHLNQRSQQAHLPLHQRYAA